MLHAGNLVSYLQKELDREKKQAVGMMMQTAWIGFLGHDRA
jgi:hypothetical protein